MRLWNFLAALFLLLIFVGHYAPAIAADASSGSTITSLSKNQNKSYTKDIAFFSVMGSRPDVKSLRGFQKAVLYNAQGAKVKEITFNKSDSIYSLDKMLQENSARGPLFIRMYR
jgi:hypothetical protein